MNIILSRYRSGRTARAGRKGTCIIIRTPCEDGAWRRTLDAVNITPHDITVNSRLDSIVVVTMYMMVIMVGI